MARQHAQRTSPKRQTRASTAEAGKIQKKQTPVAGISNHPPVEEYQRQEKVPPRGQAKE
jgi:hypothetical protein